jgi:hypothetical protein
MMFWLFVIFFVLAVVFAKVGALTVMVKILAFALNASIAIAFILGLILIWKKIKN